MRVTHAHCHCMYQPVLLYCRGLRYSKIQWECTFKTTTFNSCMLLEIFLTQGTNHQTNRCWSSLVHTRKHNWSGVANHESKSVLSSFEGDCSWRAPLVLGWEDGERAERTKHILYPNLGEVGRNCSQCDLRCCKKHSIMWLSRDHHYYDLRCMVGAITVTPSMESATSFFAFVLALASDNI